MIQTKTYFYQETNGEGDLSNPVYSFQACNLAQAKLRATRRSSRRFAFIVLGDQVDDNLNITNILAVRHRDRGWRELFGKENPFAF